MSYWLQSGAEVSTFGGASIAPSISSVTAGSLLILRLRWQRDGIATPPTTPSGWTLAIAPNGVVCTGVSSYRTGAAIYYKENAAAGSHSASITAESGSAMTGYISEYVTGVTSGSLDKTQSNSGTGSQTSGNTGTTSSTSQAYELVIGNIAAAGLSSNANIGMAAQASSGYTAANPSYQHAGTGVPGNGSHKFTTSTGTQTASWTWGQAGEYSAVIATFKSDAEVIPPRVTAVSNTSPESGTTITLTGINFQSTQGAGDVKAGGESQPIVSWSDTSVVVTVDEATNQFGVPLSLSLIDNDGTPSNTFILTEILPPAGHRIVNLLTLVVDPDMRLTAIPDLDAVDQLESDGPELFDDGSYDAGEDFYVRAWTAGEGWGAWALQTIVIAAGVVTIAGDVVCNPGDSVTLTISTDSDLTGDETESIELSDDDSGDFSPSTIELSASTTSDTTVYTPTSTPGPRAIAGVATGDPAIADGSLTVTVIALPTTIIITGDDFGIVSTAMPLTIGTDSTLIGSQSETVALEDDDSGTFSPSSVTLDATHQSVVVSYTPSSNAGPMVVTATPSGTPTITGDTKSITIVPSSLISDADYLAWLKDPSSNRIVLVEAIANVAGDDVTRYMATRAYVTSPVDVPGNQVYQPIVTTGITFTEQLSLNGSASLSFGDIEIANFSGERDSWLDDIWKNRSVKAYIGDPRWSRRDFRMILNGVISTIDSKNRDTLNLIVADKMQLLNTPIVDQVLGGSTPNQNALLPVSFGEVHNISPLLSDPVTLEYTVHNGPVESVFEVRDNGKPVSVSLDNAAGKFTLNQQSYGAITVSAQGDKPAGYSNTISPLVQRIVTSYGTAANRFTSDDLDTDNLADFDSACPQPVGLYLSTRTNVLNACQSLVSSVGAQMVMSRLGKLRIIQIKIPGAGTAVIVRPSQIIQNSLHIVSRPDVVAAVKLGFNKNYTVQAGLVTSIPEQHKDLFAKEWLTSTELDTDVRDSYKLNTEPVQVDTMLLRRIDADAEAARRLDLWKQQRTVFQFEGTEELLATLELGGAITLYNPRFDLAGGKTGIVISLAPHWLTGRITVGVLI